MGEVQNDEFAAAVAERDRYAASFGSMNTPPETIGDWAGLAEQVAQEQPSFAGQQAVLGAGYDAITRRVEPYQQALMLNAQSQIEALNADLKRIRELTRELETVAAMAEDGEPVNLDVYSAAENRAAALIDRATTAPARAEKLAADLADPLTALDDLEKRMPSLRVQPFNT